MHYIGKAAGHARNVISKCKGPKKIRLLDQSQRLKMSNPPVRNCFLA